MAVYAEWCEDLEAALAEPFPPACILTKKQGGAEIAFVPWHEYVRKLNALVGGNWSMGDPIFREVGGKLIVGLPVTVLGTTRVNFGTEDEDKDSFGDAATNAWAQAFKRTVALFGIGLHMYADKGRPQQRATRPAQQRAAPATNGNAPAQNGNGNAPAMASEAQLKRLFALAKDAGWSGEALRFYLHGCGCSTKAVPRDNYNAICEDMANADLLTRVVADMAQTTAHV